MKKIQFFTSFWISLVPIFLYSLYGRTEKEPFYQQQNNKLKPKEQKKKESSKIKANRHSSSDRLGRLRYLMIVICEVNIKQILDMETCNIFTEHKTYFLSRFGLRQ